jgi:hypothetical protein
MRGRLSKTDARDPGSFTSGVVEMFPVFLVVEFRSRLLPKRMVTRRLMRMRSGIQVVTESLTGGAIDGLRRKARIKSAIN